MCKTPRTIAIFIDGTWSRGGTTNPTNVRKLFEATLIGDVGGREQISLYIPGVGRKPKVDLAAASDADYDVQLSRHLRSEILAGTAAVTRRLLGVAFGKGTTVRIKGTYHFLCKNFDRKRGDLVYLFGFSRGAFAARSLAGFTQHVGLLLADKLDLVDKAYEIYERSEDPGQSELVEFLYKLTGRRSVSPDDEYYVPTHFLGVWDTVGSLGLPSRLEWMTAPFTEFHEVGVPPSVMTVRHALALHEIREVFEPLLLRAGGHNDLKQVWFAGAHADVGGGYKSGETGLSNLALRWMAVEANKRGLQFDDQSIWLKDSNESLMVHHEIRGPFLATFPVIRNWLKDWSKSDFETHYVHRSALDYLSDGDREGYRFAHLLVNSALRHVDALTVPKFVHLRLLGQEIEQ